VSLYVTPGAAPYVLRPGVAAVVRQTVLLRATEAAPSGVTAVSVQVYDADGAAVGSAITAAIDGAGPAYVATIPALTTTGADPSDRWSALWSYTIGSTVYEFRRVVRLVAVEVSPTVTSVELSAEYPDLTASLRASAADLRADLAEAWEDLDRDLWDAGVDLHRVFDPRHLARPHMVRAAHLRYAKAASSTRDDQMLDRARELADEYRDLLMRRAGYDSDSDGAMDTARRSTTAEWWDGIQRRPA
jgi:hypothetical protein